MIKRLARKCRNACRKARTSTGPGQERSADWYDRGFEQVDTWKLHYSKSHYYPLWCILVDRLLNAPVNLLIDVGCGPGQMAQFIHDSKGPDYVGLDFSPKRIEGANKLGLPYTFLCEDVFTGSSLQDLEYDGVLCTEFLEHVNEDLDAIGRLRPDCYFLGTVPDFPYDAHVRHFTSAAEVLKRYAPHFAELDVTPFYNHFTSHTYFIMEGRTRRHEG